MRTIEQVLAELRELGQRQQRGEDVTARTADVNRELAQLGYVPMEEVARHVRTGSRFAGPDSDPEALAHLAAGGSFDQFGRPLAAGQMMLSPGWRLSEPPAAQQRGGSGGSRTLASVMTKALAEGTDTAGGYLVPVEISRDVLTLVRNRVSVMVMRPTVVPVAKELDLPAFSTGAAAQYVAENGRLPVSEPTFALIPKLTPKEMGTVVPVSNRLLRDASTNPALDQVLQSDLADCIAVRQDLSFLEGTGTGEEPLGILNIDGKTPAPDLGADGGQPTLANFRQMVGSVRSANARFLQPGWIFHPDVLTYVETLEDSLGRPLLDTDLLKVDPTGGGGTFLGYRFQTTGNIPTTLTKGTSDDTTYVVFSSDWEEAFVGENLDLAIDASTEATYSPDGGTTHISAWQARQTVFRAISCHDFALRRPEWFTVMDGVRL